MTLLIETAVCLSMAPESEQLSRRTVNRMSATGLTSEAQLRYLLQWFGEFSELQREDFLPILAAACGGQPDQLATTLAALSCQDKPVSLFQCRIKLFNEWYPTWAEEEQDRLVKGISEIDPDFGEKLQNYITNGPPVNGDMNGFIEVHNEEALKDEDEAGHVEHVAEESEGITQESLPLEIAAAS
ncbi:unnamed protein product [Diatraea saccharalis]|uniref:Uncharacterized protein n=1 Tax=Diatraea saccharalis TaxID=40085 RepID=A0A9N9WF28_9NEOP|nr:unnamed protein product [Diatraea saccharalis]